MSRSGLLVTPLAAPADPLTRCQRKVSPAAWLPYVQLKRTWVSLTDCAFTVGSPGAVAPGPSALCPGADSVGCAPTEVALALGWPLPWASVKNATTATTATSTPPPRASTRPLGRPLPFPLAA